MKIIWLFIYAMILSNFSFAQNTQSAKRVNENNKLKIYTIFFSPGWGWGGSLPPRYVLSNEALLEKLKSKIEGVEFISRDLSKPNPSFSDYIGRTLTLTDKLEAAIEEVKKMDEEIDGVLLFKDLPNDHRLAFTGKPTIVVNNLFEFNTIPYELYKEEGKIVFADLDRLNVVSPSMADSMMNDLIGKIELIHSIKKMKNEKVLMVLDKRLRYYPQLRSDIFSISNDEWNKIYLDKLKEELGVTGIIISSKELEKEIENVANEQAEVIAKIWIDEALGMVQTNYNQVVDGAKMYLALKKLKEKYDATSILTSTAAFLESNLNITACLASMEFEKQGIVCTDQEYTGPLLAEMFGWHFAKRPSFTGDWILDRYNNTSILVHCGAPVNPHGDDRVPYHLRDYRMGGDVLVELPTGEPVTIWRVNVIDKKILVHTGNTIPLDSVYGQGINNLHGILCATKLVAKVNGQKLMENTNPQKYGVHYAATYGDYREQIKDLGKLIGFEVLEMDR